MMDRVRPSRSTPRGVEVARRGVAGRLQLTLSVRRDVRVRSLEPIVVLPYLRRPMAVETSKGNTSKAINFERGVEANLRGGVPGGSWRSGESSYTARTVGERRPNRCHRGPGGISRHG